MGFGDPKKTDKRMDEAAQAKMRKWCESCWKMTIYIAFTTLALVVCWGEVSACRVGGAVCGGWVGGWGWRGLASWRDCWCRGRV